LITSLRTVGPEQEGVILFLGKYSRTVQPGLNYIVPFGLERMYKIPVQRQLKQEFGFRTVEPGVRTQYSKEAYRDESLMLTGDLNLADVEWVVQYRIVIPTNTFSGCGKPKTPCTTWRRLPCARSWATAP
jgi:modulator of FtsH protease HflK